jgi:hypothetical protein
MIKETSFTISTGVSRGINTQGYKILTLRDSNKKIVSRVCGGGFDMFNTVLCDAITKTYQNELRATLNGIDLADSGLYYCFQRDTKGNISVTGGSGSGTTYQLCLILNIRLIQVDNTIFVKSNVNKFLEGF